MGFAPARRLFDASIADVLDEDTGEGYQRRFNKQHSLDFRRYIHQPSATTIPLTFNLRAEDSTAWEIKIADGGRATLEIDLDRGRPLYQVDCQHRIGHLGDSEVSLAFMAFVGLNAVEEMEIFNTINSKAKGLSTSLLDYHEARLAKDLELERPELFIALQLQEDPESPWYQRLDLGGTTTSGLQRKASLRTMQKAVKRFLRLTKILDNKSAAEAYVVVRDYWRAVVEVLEEEWATPRKHFLTKGIGVYALMTIAGDLYLDALTSGAPGCEVTYFESKLADFAPDFDWSNTGPLKGLGGESGANEAASLLRELRKVRALKVVG